MRKFCFGLVACAFAVSLSAQTISNKVMPSVGGVMSSSTHQITFTLGETLIPTLSTSGIMLTQGFQQPDVARNLSLQNPGTNESLVAFVENGTAKVLWGTATTAKTGSFTLERLNNETGNYETIETRPINATKATLAEYDFTDKDPQDGDNVYRIKQIVLNQLPAVSESRKLNFNTDAIATVFPNPAVEYVNLDLSSYLDRGADISIFSNAGQLMFQQKIEKISGQPVKLQLDNIETGNYQMRIKIADKKSLIVKSLIISK